jgi:hypothetical protein
VFPALDRCTLPARPTAIRRSGGGDQPRSSSAASASCAASFDDGGNLLDSAHRVLSDLEIPDADHGPTVGAQRLVDLPIPCHVVGDLLVPVPARATWSVTGRVPVPERAVHEYGDLQSQPRDVGPACYSADVAAPAITSPSGNSSPSEYRFLPSAIARSCAIRRSLSAIPQAYGRRHDAQRVGPVSARPLRSDLGKRRRSSTTRQWTPRRFGATSFPPSRSAHRAACCGHGPL